MDFHAFWALFAFFIGVSICQLRDFTECHNEFDVLPHDGVLHNHYAFTWLGYIQYIHTRLGVPHALKAPRVVLVQRQFVIGAAREMVILPKNYRIGNVIFGRYERDEITCGLTKQDIWAGKVCEPAFLEIPPSDIIIHPEYTRFRIGNSLGLMKLIRPLQSEYVVPVCLPSIYERARLRKKRSVILIDYINIVPTNFDLEIMAKLTLTLHTDEECRRHATGKPNVTKNINDLTNLLCTSGCGVRSGAPIITHVMSGPFELVGIAAASGTCMKKEMRSEFNSYPPLYIDIYPYVTWIVNVITAHLIPQSYPNKVMRSGSRKRGSDDKKQIMSLRTPKDNPTTWIRTIYMMGACCSQGPTTHMQSSDIDRPDLPQNAFFYAEHFLVNTTLKTKVHIKLKVSAGIECTICCIKVKMPNKRVEPTVIGIGTYKIELNFSTEWFPDLFTFQAALMGTNTSSQKLGEYAADVPKNIWLP